MPKLQIPSSFRSPAKLIQDADGLKRFLASQGVKDFVGFILSLNQAVVGTKLSQQYELSPTLATLKSMLDQLWQLVDGHPPVQQSLRYGNPAFRTWFAAMSELLPSMLSQADRQALVCVVFNRYLELMRHIQTTYWLEPAGSHGVWGLDDYQFLPFVWGSAQLTNNTLIRPKSIHNQELLDAYGDDYMYLSCVKFVKSVKKGSLHETSPMLDDVSSVPTWAKVNSGMVKMYQVEVLSKFPIMQHFLFGSLLPLDK
eukprot:gene3379-3654_t